VPQLIAKTSRSTVEVIGRVIICASTSDPADPSAVKKSVRHSFDFPVQFPKKVTNILTPLFNRVVAEVSCEELGWAEWAHKISEATQDGLMRSWVASIAWWDFGLDQTGNELSDLVKPLPLDFEGCDKELEKVLRKIGYPTPADRVKQLPVDKRGINRRLAKLGLVRPKITERKK
jgi:hypothetical protein